MVSASFAVVSVIDHGTNSTHAAILHGTPRLSDPFRGDRPGLVLAAAVPS